MNHTTSSQEEQGKPGYTIYLYHFDEKLAHSQHYCGCTQNLERRTVLHMTGQSNAKIMRALYLAKINFRIARTWLVDTPELEGMLKRSHNLARYCPICRSQRVMARIADKMIPVPLASLFATESSLQQVLPL